MQTTTCLRWTSPGRMSPQCTLEHMSLMRTDVKGSLDVRAHQAATLAIAGGSITSPMVTICRNRPRLSDCCKSNSQFQMTCHEVRSVRQDAASQVVSRFGDGILPGHRQLATTILRQHNSRNSLDWSTDSIVIYTGAMHDCKGPGIAGTLAILNYGHTSGGSYNLPQTTLHHCLS